MKETLEGARGVLSMAGHVGEILVEFVAALFVAVVESRGSQLRERPRLPPWPVGDLEAARGFVSKAGHVGEKEFVVKLFVAVIEPHGGQILERSQFPPWQVRV